MQSREFQPDIPATIDGVILEGPWAESWMAEPFILGHEQQSRSLWLGMHNLRDPKKTGYPQKMLESLQEWHSPELPKAL